MFAPSAGFVSLPSADVRRPARIDKAAPQDGRIRARIRARRRLPNSEADAGDEPDTVDAFALAEDASPVELPQRAPHVAEGDGNTAADLQHRIGGTGFAPEELFFAIEARDFTLDRRVCQPKQPVNERSTGWVFAETPTEAGAERREIHRGPELFIHDIQRFFALTRP